MVVRGALYGPQWPVHSWLRIIRCIEPPHFKGAGDLTAEATLWYASPQTGAGPNHAGLHQRTASSSRTLSWWDELDFAWKFEEETIPLLYLSSPPP